MVRDAAEFHTPVCTTDERLCVRHYVRLGYPRDRDELRQLPWQALRLPLVDANDVLSVTRQAELPIKSSAARIRDDRSSGAGISRVAHGTIHEVRTVGVRSCSCPPDVLALTRGPRRVGSGGRRVRC